MISFRAACAAAALAGLAVPALAQTAAPAPAPAQPPAFKRIELVKQMFPPEKYATWMYMVVVEPGGVVPRHTHPGIEMGYMIEGEATTLKVEGQPDLEMKAESTYNVPPGVPHEAKNNGTKPAKIIATFVVEKDKPLASPAAKP